MERRRESAQQDRSKNSDGHPPIVTRCVLGIGHPEKKLPRRGSLMCTESTTDEIAGASHTVPVEVRASAPAFLNTGFHESQGVTRQLFFAFVHPDIRETHRG